MNHPVNGTPRIYCLHEENNELTLIEEYISGNTLAELLQDGQPISESTAAEYTLELCSIIESLHKFNPPIIHRDIKPSNVIITPNNHVVLIDLNAARSSTLREEDTVLLGTKGYAAPEQYGFGSSNIQTDIYAIGMLFNTMLRGEFSHNIVVDSRYHGIIDRCTRINPKERFRNITQLRQKIRKAQKSPYGSSKWRRFLPPGFRSLNPVHMIIATPVYVFVFFIFTTIEFKDMNTFELWLDRIMLILASLTVISCCTNYLNIQRFMPLCSSSKKLVRILGTVLLSFILFAALVFTD
ncbi:MAG: protein kinase, partial [Lachnospiraceae bacterium]|nr:protein kinase [Lachnospiraceae bacterium]